MSGYASIHGTDSSETIDTTGQGNRSDWIWAKDGNDTISSGGGDDGIHAGSGKDLVYAGTGNDTVFGQAAQDRLYGEGGNDFLDGGNSNDLLSGGAGNDALIGGKQDDTLEGGAGNDLLTGDGTSLMSGDAQGTGAYGTSNDGQDVFYFDNGFGQDTILDFNLGDDMLEIRSGINGTGISNPTDLVPYIGEASGNAVITIGADSITLVGVSKADLLANLQDVVDIV
ncbi:calcium-binding protein [Falsiroseomonas sp. CW058]|uniref:calcium-binding protein n=1 Tax=Falsiroseomonas sp. CW058 TaxID=3388664 RepID=UPI003D314ABE